MSSYTMKKTIGDTSWFTNDRFGMFIHFGLYSMPARKEWIKKIECIPEEKYDLYFKHFNPDMLDAKKWAKCAKEAGMKYVVLTTKHHEGFCLFDSKYTDYKVTNTPYKRDIVKEYVDAFRAEGIRIGFYYSLLDWHHPDFPIDKKHPRRNDPNAEELDKGRDVRKYAEYMRNQVTELLTDYGKIDILWFDFSYSGETDDNSGDNTYDWMQFGGGKGKEQWESEKLIEVCRKLQPDVIINNRCEIDQDIWTPEQHQPTDWMRDKTTGEYLTWETCHTMSGTWGYNRDETTWKSPEMLLNLLIDSVSLGGNLIMNVGPTARGYLDYRAENALKVYADWMKYNSRSIYGCTMADAEFKAPNGCVFTQSIDGKRLYVHLIKYPFRYLELPGLVGRVEYAQFLHDGSEVLFEENGLNAEVNENYSKDLTGTLLMHLPILKPNTLVPVIEIFLK